jgi:peptidase M42 family hydrolase
METSEPSFELPADRHRPRLLPIDMDYLQQVMLHLLRTPSPSGRTDHVIQLIGDEMVRLGIDVALTRRGVLLGELPGEDPTSPDRAVIVHADTIGLMVADLKENGRLEVVPVGSHSARFAEGARVTLFIDDLHRTFTGTVLPLKASGHRYGDEVDTAPIGWEHVEVRLDEPVRSRAELAALGINVGDFVAFDADPVITPSGYVKARHLDDKAGVACVLAACKAVIDHGAVLPVNAHLLVTIAEEVGHGASHGLDADVAELISIDNAVVAPRQQSSERTVNIAMQDSTGPFDYHLCRRLIQLCEANAIPYRRDVFGFYRSDAASALEAGAETRASVVGFGVDASHGHERTHLDSLKATTELIATYLQTDLTFWRWDSHPRGELSGFPSTLVQPADDLGPR